MCMYLYLPCVNNSTYVTPQLHQYQYYSTGMLSNYDKYPEHFKTIAGPRKKISREQKKMEKKVKGELVLFKF